MPIIDRTKPLKIEDLTKGGELDFAPTEVNPLEDGLCAAGLDINGENNKLIEADSSSNNIVFTDPTNSSSTLIELRTAATNIFDNSTNGFTANDVQAAIEEANILNIQENSSLIQSSTNTLNFRNNLKVTDDGSSTVTIDVKNKVFLQYTFVGQMNFDQYLYSWQHDGSGSRRSGDPSNGWQFQNSSPMVMPFDGIVKKATFRNRGVAQSTGTPAANMTLLYELWRVAVTGGEGTKLGDVSVTFTTAGKTIGNFWNSAVNTDLNEINDSLNISVARGDLLGLKFIRQTGASNVVSVNNALVVLEIEEDL